MIISCQNCKAAFIVAAEQIGATGRKVKCSKCQNMWYATVPADVLYNEQLATEHLSAPPHNLSYTNLPVVISTKISKTLFFAPLFMLILIVATFFVFYPNLMNKFGLCKYVCEPYNVRIQDISYEFDSSHKKIMIEYSIANNTLAKARLPLIEVKLIDSSNNILQKTYIENNDIWLDPDGSVKAKTEFDNISPHSKFVRIALGSKIKFLFR